MRWGVLLGSLGAMFMINVAKASGHTWLPAWARRSFALACVLMSNSAISAKAITYYYTDPQGTVLVVSDSDGGSVSESDYSPFGSVVLGQSSSGPAYAGHVDDVETALVYMQGRYMDPRVGRFISTDPKAPIAGDLGNFSRYAYANDNPYLFIDPDGRSPRLLGDLKLIRKNIVDAGNRVMVAITGLIKDRADKTEISASASLGARGAGISANKSLYNGGDSVSVESAGWKFAYEASLNVKTEIVSIDFSSDTAPSRFSYIGHMAGYEVIGGGVEVMYNKGGKLSVSVIAGTGAGESVWGGEVSMDMERQKMEEAQAEYMKDQEIRELMGIQPENNRLF